MSVFLLFVSFWDMMAFDVGDGRWIIGMWGRDEVWGRDVVWGRDEVWGRDVG